MTSKSAIFGKTKFYFKLDYKYICNITKSFKYTLLN